MTLSYAPFGDDEEKQVVIPVMPPKPKEITTNSITECNYILAIFIISMVIFTQTS